MKKRLMIIILVLVLFIVGCNRPFQTPENAMFDKYVGTQGLYMQFYSGVPPARLYATPTTQLNILVELWNRGASNIRRGKLFLTGYDPLYIPIQDNQLEIFDFEGKTEFNPEGTYKTLEFKAFNLYLPQGVDRITQNFVVTSLYDYETIANPIVCIDPTPYDPVKVGGRTCVPNTVQLSGGQGAPVSVSNVEVQSTGERVFFKIHIANVGDGSVVLEGEDSPFGLSYDKINRVYYDVTLGGIHGQCSPENPMRLSNEQGIIQCSFFIPAEQKSAYQTPLRIGLRYAYVQEISTMVQLLRVPT